MAGRPPLDNGEHGVVNRTELAPNVWRARARFRGPDGVTRSVQRDTPAGVRDTDGAVAEKALTDVFEEFGRSDGHRGTVTLQTELATLAQMYLDHPDREKQAIRTRDTYARIVRLLLPRLGPIRIVDATPRRLSRILDQLALDHGQTTAKQAKTVLAGMFSAAVRDGALTRNPAHDIDPIRVDVGEGTDPARVLTGEELARLLDGVQNSDAPLPPRVKGKKIIPKRTVSQWTHFIDFVDPITLLAGTGLRRSELLGLLWSDYDRDNRTITVAGHVIRSSGSGLVREGAIDARQPSRTIELPDFAVEMLDRRRGEVRPVTDGIEDVIFPSSVGTYRDPDNFARQWRRIREALGFDWVGTRTIRKSVATFADARALDDALASGTRSTS
ncbi:tyrosine-type recombinase/integrase [Rhodococcus sp. NPDC003318]|uniref:tyrosine-type recombinase/integrase n=1 Tax=Rhodococcus sp. NPDC003318 TaxID=3364503 RepID=UPI00369692AC